jgi:hypothetical protein
MKLVEVCRFLHQSRANLHSMTFFPQILSHRLHIRRTAPLTHLSPKRAMLRAGSEIWHIAQLCRRFIASCRPSSALLLLHARQHLKKRSRNYRIQRTMYMILFDIHETCTTAYNSNIFFCPAARSKTSYLLMENNFD